VPYARHVEVDPAPFVVHGEVRLDEVPRARGLGRRQQVTSPSRNNRLRVLRETTGRQVTSPSKDNMLTGGEVVVACPTCGPFLPSFTAYDLGVNDLKFRGERLGVCLGVAAVLDGVLHVCHLGLDSERWSA